MIILIPTEVYDPRAKLLAVEDVAVRLALSPATIRRYYRATLPWIKVGGELRLSEADLLQFIESRRAA